jgi:DNA end-binding protein Ku
MARPVWKGAISFGLVTVPVAMYPASERKETLHFRLLHEKDQSPVEYKRFCTEEDKAVPWNEIVKGYEYEKGHFVVMTDKDFEHARTPATQVIAITDFVPKNQIDPLYFDTPYYLEPAAKGAAKGFALLRDALHDGGRVGIGTLVLRQREHLVALDPAGAALVCSTLRYQHELRPTKSLDLPAVGRGWSKQEMTLAHRLIEALASDWEPSKYADTYTDVLKAAIAAKMNGHAVKAVKTPPLRAVPGGLMKALEQSLRQPRKDLARAGRPRRRAVGRRAARSTAA